MSTTYNRIKLAVAIRNNARRSRITCCQYGCNSWSTFVVAGEVPTDDEPSLPVCGLHATWALRHVLENGATSATVWPGEALRERT